MTFEEIYLIGVLVAFGAFGLTLFSISLWSGQPGRRPARIRRPAKR